MKKKLFFYSLSYYSLLFSIGCFLVISTCFAMQNPNEEDMQRSFQQKPFKLGFEFQESSGLCPWASNNFNVQKKALFSLHSSKTNDKLWHVEIDTDDIEFVTRPFTHFERDELAEGIETIIASVNCLKENLTEDISFQTWMEALQLLFQGRIKCSEETLNYPFWNSVNLGIKKPSLETWIPSFSPQATIQHPLEDTIFLYFGLFGFKSFTTMHFAHSIPYRNLFKEAHSEANAQKIEEVVVRRFKSKFGGLMFLGALTLIGMAPVDGDVTDRELLKETKKMFKKSKQVDPKLKLPIMSRRPFSEMISNIFPGMKMLPQQFIQGFMGALEMSPLIGLPSYFHKANYAEQFFGEDGKALNLTHWIDCFEDNLVYEDGYSFRIMLKNPSQEDLEGIKPGELGVFYKDDGFIYCKTHKKEEIQITSDNENLKNGLPINVIEGILSALKASQKIEQNNERALFQHTLLKGYTQNNRAILLYLLEKGIVSTTMLRNLKPNFDVPDSPIVPLLNNPLQYFYSVVGSVVDPTHRYKINPYGNHVAPLLIREKSSKDGLSPPWFLELSNSMGAFESYSIDLNYGEAVIEVRAIREIGDWFLRKNSIQNRKEGFLGRIDKTLIEDSLFLFDFLNQFRDNEYEILLGITHAVYSHTH